MGNAARLLWSILEQCLYLHTPRLSTGAMCEEDPNILWMGNQGRKQTSAVLMVVHCVHDSTNTSFFPVSLWASPTVSQLSFPRVRDRTLSRDRTSTELFHPQRVESSFSHCFANYSLYLKPSKTLIAQHIHPNPGWTTSALAHARIQHSWRRGSSTHHP